MEYVAKRVLIVLYWKTLKRDQKLRKMLSQKRFLKQLRKLNKLRLRKKNKKLTLSKLPNP